MVRASTEAPTHSTAQLTEIFDKCFRVEYNTRLQGGGQEPVYMPQDSGCEWHRVIFTHDYFASALHEVAHWCIAGEARRSRPDYGYWYAPDGRSEAQQRVFEQVEVYPQALEWIFAECCAYRFRISVDNLTLDAKPSAAFVEAVAQHARRLCRHGLPGRAHRFAVELARYYKVAGFYRPERYQSRLLQNT